LKSAGFLLVIATNQPDVGRGTLGKDVVEAIHLHLASRLPIDRIEVCYDPGGGTPPSEDRKPRPGMLLRAARALDISLESSFMVGDRWRDIDCGHAAGCTTLLIDYGYHEPLKTPPDYTVQGLSEAADIIIGLLNPPDMR
jgi:D-glycero-D-manno-heptose 1,7-bisphosphate phosphatase